MNRALLFFLLALAACSANDVSDRYRSERELFGVESRFKSMRKSSGMSDRQQLRELAAEFEAVVAGVPEGAPAALQLVEAEAWLRAAQCHQALGDSGRAELILASAVTRYKNLPLALGEISYRLGQVAEHHGHYREALAHYQNTMENIPPDPGPDPDPDAIVDPDAEPEEDRADDFVLDLPLRMARIAALDSTITDGPRYYDQARSWYSRMLDDDSPFVQVQAAVLLADTEADLGRWRAAWTILDELERSMPVVVRTEVRPADVRARSFGYRVRAWVWGAADGDSVRAALDGILEDYGRTSVAPAAIHAMARGLAETGDVPAAIALLERLHRDYPTATVLPDAELFHARLLAESGEWAEAERSLRALPRDYPTTMAALQAPLEIVAWHRRSGDDAAANAALVRAEREYRDTITRYPTGPHSFFTRRQLVRTLDLSGRPADALEELLALCNDIALPAQRPGLLFDAARRAEHELGEPARAFAILQRVAEEFPNTRTGRRAVREANRLRPTFD